MNIALRKRVVGLKDRAEREADWQTAADCEEALESRDPEWSARALSRVMMVLDAEDWQPGEPYETYEVIDPPEWWQRLLEELDG